MATPIEIQDTFEVEWLHIMAINERNASQPPEIEFAFEAANLAYTAKGIGRSRVSVTHLCLERRRARLVNGRPPRGERKPR